MPAKAQGNSEKLDQVYKEVKKHTKDIAGLKEQFEAMNERQQRFEEKQDRFETMLLEQIKEAREDREKNDRFRNEIYTMVDHVMKLFENFQVEKLALGAKQDRLETEVEALQESDEKQNKTLAKLDARVEYLEAKAP